MPLLGGVDKAERSRVQGLPRKRTDLGADRSAPRKAPSCARAVDWVADQGVAAMSQMDPNLMCPTGGETASHERRMAAERALDAIARYGRFSSALVDHRHFLAVSGAAADIAGDLTLRRCGHAPNKCGIGAVDP